MDIDPIIGGLVLIGAVLLIGWGLSRDDDDDPEDRP